MAAAAKPVQKFWASMATELANTTYPTPTTTRLTYTLCLLYTSDAADERSSVDLGGRRIIKKKKQRAVTLIAEHINKKQ